MSSTARPSPTLPRDLDARRRRSTRRWRCSPSRARSQAAGEGQGPQAGKAAKSNGAAAGDGTGKPAARQGGGPGQAAGSQAPRPGSRAEAAGGEGPRPRPRRRGRRAAGQGRGLSAANGRVPAPPPGRHAGPAAALEGGAAALHQASAGPVGKREIARRFGLGPSSGPRCGIAEGAEGGSGRSCRGRPAAAFGARRACRDRRSIEVAGTDRTAIRWPGRSAGSRPGRRPPLDLHAPGTARQPALAPGERVLARLKRPAAASTRHRPSSASAAPPRPGCSASIEERPRSSRPTAEHKAEWLVPPGEAGGAEPGEIVLAEPLPGRASSACAPPGSSSGSARWASRARSR